MFGNGGAGRRGSRVGGSERPNDILSANSVNLKRKKHKRPGYGTQKYFGLTGTVNVNFGLEPVTCIMKKRQMVPREYITARILRRWRIVGEWRRVEGWRQRWA